MAASPKLAPQVELVFEKKIPKRAEPKPIEEKPPVRDLLTEIFGGHEEFLGWTPD